MKNFPVSRFEILCALCVLGGSISSAQPTETQYLSGHGKDDAVPWKFFCTTNAQSGFWTNLPVPSCWELHGFGKISYHRDATNSYDERGLYEHEFSVPESWRGKRIFLVFDGAMTDTSAKLNGQSCGPVHQGAYYRFKYEVTPLVNFGATNKLEVEVAKHSANASVNGAERTGDYWMYGGIFRPVYLEAEPQQFIERVAIDAQADGKFSAQVFLNGLTNASEVEAQIQTLDGKTVGEPFAGGIIYGGERPDLAVFKTQILSPKLWTAETPNLYKVIFRLKKDGKTVHEISQRFGFRTFEVRDGDGLYLNGQRVVFKGCNRHSFWPDSGRTLSTAVHKLDIETMKAMNMNAVRMSHYPPDAEFLDLCDELGLYVLDELGGWHKYYDTEAGTKLVKEMVTRDANHPSILFWDNGNEGGFNTKLDKIFGEYDLQNRRVLHPWAPFSGLNTVHYPTYDFVQLACAGIPVVYKKEITNYVAFTNSPDKLIFMPTEFMHGLYDGGAGAGLADVWGAMARSKLLGGGFIWAFLDEGIRRADTGQIDVSSNEAPDGIVGPYREREGSFYAIKQIWSPIQITRDTNSRNFSFTVQNHFSFTDAKDCKFTWEWRRYPQPMETGTNFTVVSRGVFKSPAIPPGGTWKLEFEKIPPAIGDALAVRVDGPDGRELWTWVWPKNENAAARLADGPGEHPAVPGETNGTITVQTGDLTAMFSKETGWLAGVRRGGQFYSLTNGPRPAVGSAVLKEIHFDSDGPDAVVSAKYDGALKSVLWRVYNNGWIQCRYEYHAEGTNDFAGVLFDCPENLVKAKRWLGGGPYRVWKNRPEGATFGLWQNDYNTTITGWRGWVYPEFKGCFADVRWLQLETAEGEITMANASGVPFVQVLTPEFPPRKQGRDTTPNVPACGLGLLDIIPPVGSTGQRAEKVSPSGALGVAHGDYGGTVNFYFGALPAAGDFLEQKPNH